ncbi:MAG: hypothetical protein GY811_13800 [Myxococcales bacterium]|nr:hypothetical protein [Myxococcales bacterium]
MYKFFKSSLLVIASLGLLACGSDGEEVEPVSALENADSVREARDFLTSAADDHTSQVISRDVLAEVTLDEVHFHDRSFEAVAQMEWHLRLLATCRSAEGKALDTTGALAALRELRAELEAHKVGMITMVDRDTAKAAEAVFHARQAPLFEELESHCENFVAQAESYDCAF